MSPCRYWIDSRTDVGINCRQLRFCDCAVRIRNAWLGVTVCNCWNKLLDFSAGYFNVDVLKLYVIEFYKICEIWMYFDAKWFGLNLYSVAYYWFPFQITDWFWIIEIDCSQLTASLWLIWFFYMFFFTFRNIMIDFKTVQPWYLNYFWLIQKCLNGDLQQTQTYHYSLLIICKWHFQRERT